MAIQGIAIFLITLLLVWQSSAATLDSTGPKEQGSDSETSGGSAAAAAAAKNSGGGGTGDLVAALEKLAGGQIGTAQSVRRSAGSAAAGRQPAAAPAAAADLYETSKTEQDEALLAELDRIEARVRDAAPSTESEAGDGFDDDDEPRRVTADDLRSLLDLLGKVSSRAAGDASDDSVQTGRQSERRMFTNSGGRGKKEEPSVAAEAAIVDADVRGVVRELAGVVRELAVRYFAQKERTDRVLTILAKVVESLVSP